MQSRKILFFIVQAAVLGLALAFLLSVLWPDILKPTTDSLRPGGASNRASYADAVAKAAPAVVNINTARLETVPLHPFLSDPEFRRFFKDKQIRPQKRLKTSLGSGVIFRQDGYILTNHHVIKGAQVIHVYLRDGRSAQAKMIGSDPESDLAVLRIPLSGLPTASLQSSVQPVRVGDVVLAIGNPYGFGHTVTQGIVSAIGRDRLGINTFENFIQTDAAINPGNSGGALINADGRLIGINTAIFSQTGGTQGIGFAIPVNLATSVFTDILRHGRVIRGWVGINAAPVTSAINKALKLKTNTGIIVVSVVIGSPAAKVGLRSRDVIVAINDRPLLDSKSALHLIAGSRPGSRLKLKILRSGKSRVVTVTTSERPQLPNR